MNGVRIVRKMMRANGKPVYIVSFAYTPADFVGDWQETVVPEGVYNQSEWRRMTTRLRPGKRERKLIKCSAIGI